LGGFLFLLFVIVASITSIVKRRTAKINELLSSPQTQHRLLQTQGFLKMVENSKTGYFTYSKKEKLQSYYESLYAELSKPVYRRLNSDQITQFNKVYSDLDQLVVRWNEQFVKQELRNNASLFDDIDSKSLDEQQRRAVVVDEDNNLILAGAGSGKTLTISAKVKYLVEKKNVNPEEILLISFTRRAAEEMQDRITNKLGLNVAAKTFHKLGLDIISQEQGYRPDIFEDLSTFVNRYFKEKVISNRFFKEQVVRFIGYYLHIAKDLEEFLNLGEVHSHYKSADFETIKSKIAAKTDELKQDKTTIKGEVVKSLEEVII
jgi:DNA helicase-4